MHWHNRYQLIEESLTLIAALRGIRPGNSVSKFEQRYDGNRKVVITAMERNSFQ